MNKFFEIFLVSLLILLICYLGVFFTDFFMCRSLNMPLFVWAVDTADDGGSGIYQGLGYKVKISVHLDAESGKQLEKVEMYVFDKCIAASIADFSNDNFLDNEEINNENLVDDDFTFDCIVVDNSDYTLTLEPDADEPIRKSADRIVISVYAPLPEGQIRTCGTADWYYAIGTRLRVTYSGYIKETYPAQVEAVNVERIIPD